MANQQLVAYVQQQLAAGVSKEQIGQALAAQGWSIADINEALIAAGAVAAPAAPVPAPVTPPAAPVQGAAPIAAPVAQMPHAAPPAAAATPPRSGMFSGRIGVGQYWLSALMLLLGTIAASLAVVVGSMFLIAPLLRVSFFGSLIPLVGMLAVFAVALVCSIGLQVRRFHDFGVTGWAVLWLWILNLCVGVFMSVTPGFYVRSGTQRTPTPLGSAVSLVVFIAIVIILSIPGTKGQNAYGAPTRYRSLISAIRGMF